MNKVYEYPLTESERNSLIKEIQSKPVSFNLVDVLKNIKKRIPIKNTKNYRGIYCIPWIRPNFRVSAPSENS